MRILNERRADYIIRPMILSNKKQKMDTNETNT